MRPGLLISLLRAEGPRAVADRLRDRWREASERRRHRLFDVASPPWRRQPFPALSVLTTPPARRLGGVQVQLAARRQAQEAMAPFAILFPLAGRWRLEVTADGRRWAADLGAWTPSAPPALADAGFVAAVRRAAGVVGTGLIHLEQAAGVPLASLLDLARGGAQPALGLVASLHDFALFCPRADLVAQPDQRFCDYCRDATSCARCLGVDWPRAATNAERRVVASELLAAAAAIVFPSSFLAVEHRRLFGVVPAREVLLAPPADLAPGTGVSAAAARRFAGGPRPLRHVAMAGRVTVANGGRLFAELVRQLAPVLPEVRWSVYGGGDPALLAELRAAGVRIVGYYRSGTLSSRLVADDVDVVALPSTCPESYCLVLDECLRAAVPVVAFAVGALGERVPALAAGVLVPLEAGGEGIVRHLTELAREGVAPPPLAMVEGLPSAAGAASAILALYREVSAAASAAASTTARAASPAAVSPAARTPPAAGAPAP